MKTIEQLEQEKADILAKALKLAEAVRASGPLRRDTDEAVAAIEALKPEPERLRCFINVYVDGTRNHYASEDSANSVEDAFNVIARRAVPMIEVIPFEGEVPTWEEWDAKQVGDELMRSNTDLYQDGETFADRHNAEMRRAFDFIAKLLAERGEG